MSDLEPELDARTIEALKHVPPADSETRERHLATALSHLATPTSSRRATRWVAQAAAVVALVGAGFAVGWSSSNRGTSDLADGGAIRTTDSTMIVKGAGAVAPGGNDTTAQEGATCIGEDLMFVARYESTGGSRGVYVRTDPKPTLVILDESTCSVVREIDLP